MVLWGIIKCYFSSNIKVRQGNGNENLEQAIKN